MIFCKLSDIDEFFENLRSSLQRTGVVVEADKSISCFAKDNIWRKWVTVIHGEAVVTKRKQEVIDCKMELQKRNNKKIVMSAIPKVLDSLS